MQKFFKSIGFDANNVICTFFVLTMIYQNCNNYNNYVFLFKEILTIKYIYRFKIFSATTSIVHLFSSSMFHSFVMVCELLNVVYKIGLQGFHILCFYNRVVVDSKTTDLNQIMRTYRLRSMYHSYTNRLLNLLYKRQFLV